MPSDPDQRIADVVAQQQSRLRRFIRRRIPNAEDVEDILQDVFAELVEANRRLMPIGHVSGWLFRVARNRIIDRFRRKAPFDFAQGRPERFGDARIVTEDGEILKMEDLVPSGDASPEGVYMQQMLLHELQRALSELPEEQRRVFVEHEIEGKSFKQMAADTGENVNTLLSRKRYAVLHLRERLQRAFNEVTRARGR